MLNRQVLFRPMQSAQRAALAAAALVLSPAGAQAEEASIRDTDFARMCRGEATAEQVQRLRHHFHTRKTRSVLDRALWQALSQHCRPEVVDMLLGAGASPNIRDRRGVTVLVFAAEKGNAEGIRLLLAAGAQVNGRTKDGETALMRAAMHRRSEAVKLLLAAGADASLKDSDGLDALWHARNQADNDEVTRMLEGGAQKTAQAKPQEAAKAAAALAKTYTNSIGMEFVLIPAGTFQMGCSSEAEECSDDEKPRHEVTISKPFYLGKYEVTQAQWEAVMGSNPSHYKGANHPVDSVSWNDAQEFIKKLNAKEGHSRYRLPTEAEWEYAARAGSTTAYSFGNDAGRLKNYAWYEGNSGEAMHPVGRKQPNAWGLFDMHGNVMEWVQDWYGAYSAEAAVDPQGPEAGEGHVLRGGASINFAKVCRSAFRGDGTDFYGGSRDDDFGFRLALTPEQ